MHFRQVRRREFIALRGGATAAAPILQTFAARAQQPAKLPIIELLPLVHYHPPDES